MLGSHFRANRLVHSFYRISNLIARHWKVVSVVSFLLLLELLFHIRSFDVVRPTTNLDPPFHVGCQDPILNRTARANATLVMLARNSDVDGAVASVKNVQEQFNQHFNYPWVFLNDNSWSDEFVTKVRQAGGNTSMVFETIPSHMWGYPAWIDQKKARGNMDEMERQGIIYSGIESYHHMCRFQSG